MPDYLIIILTIAVVFIILATIYGLILIRRTHIVMKKVDYLVEDITYKSEVLSPVVDSLLKLSSYVDVMEDIIKNNAVAIKKVTDRNSNAIKKYVGELEKVLNE